MGKFSFLEFNISKISVDINFLGLSLCTSATLWHPSAPPPYLFARTIPHPRLSSVRVICYINKNRQYSLSINKNSTSITLLFTLEQVLVVTNRATQDIFPSLKVKFFYHFYIPFFFLTLRPAKSILRHEKISLVALFTTTIIFHIPFLSLFLVKKDIMKINV